jgi:hypothetical protein
MIGKTRVTSLATATLIALIAAGSARAQQPTPGAPGDDPNMQRSNTPPIYPPRPGHAPSYDLKPGGQHSSNVKLVGHVPLGGYLHVSDIDIEQELSRPYAYVTKRFHPTGVDIIDLHDPSKPKVIWQWRIENSELHQGSGALNPMYFKSKGRYYLTVATQFAQGGPDVDLGAVVFDITGLPNVATIKEVGRIRMPEAPGGFHESYAYKHSNGTPYLVTTSTGPWANIFDMEKFIAGKPDYLAGKIPIPEGVNTGNRLRGYHDFFIGYDPATHKDKFYGAGAGGYHVYDITNPEAPQLLFSATGLSGITYGHTITPTPDGSYAVVETEYQYAPLRMLDMRDGQAGKVKNISRPIGAWTATWQDLAHNHQVRWPYVFVSAYEDGLQIFNFMDPTNPVTTGFFRTYEGPHEGRAPGNVNIGAWGVQVRNADGLIVISDMATGFWAFKMEGFDGWNGHDWGFPNISSAQDWDYGPEGAP